MEEPKVDGDADILLQAKAINFVVPELRLLQELGQELLLHFDGVEQARVHNHPEHEYFLVLNKLGILRQQPPHITDFFGPVPGGMVLLVKHFGSVFLVLHLIHLQLLLLLPFLFIVVGSDIKLIPIIEKLIEELILLDYVLNVKLIASREKQIPISKPANLIDLLLKCLLVNQEIRSLPLQFLEVIQLLVGHFVGI